MFHFKFFDGFIAGRPDSDVRLAKLIDNALFAALTAVAIASKNPQEETFFSAKFTFDDLLDQMDQTRPVARTPARY